MRVQELTALLHRNTRCGHASAESAADGEPVPERTGYVHREAPGASRGEAMPTMVPMELSDRVQDRQSDVEDHLNSGSSKGCKK